MSVYVKKPFLVLLYDALNKCIHCYVNIHFVRAIQTWVHVSKHLEDIRCTCTLIFKISVVFLTQAIFRALYFTPNDFFILHSLTVLCLSCPPPPLPIFQLNRCQSSISPPILLFVYMHVEYFHSLNENNSSI